MAEKNSTQLQQQSQQTPKRASTPIAHQQHAALEQGNNHSFGSDTSALGFGDSPPLAPDTTELARTVEQLRQRLGVVEAQARMQSADIVSNKVGVAQAQAELLNIREQLAVNTAMHNKLFDTVSMLASTVSSHGDVINHKLTQKHEIQQELSDIKDMLKSCMSEGGDSGPVRQSLEHGAGAISAELAGPDPPPKHTRPKRKFDKAHPTERALRITGLHQLAYRLGVWADTVEEAVDKIIQATAGEQLSYADIEAQTSGPHKDNSAIVDFYSVTDKQYAEQCLMSHIMYYRDQGVCIDRGLPPFSCCRTISN